jgi:hypothetical protein
MHTVIAHNNRDIYGLYSRDKIGNVLTLQGESSEEYCTFVPTIRGISRVRHTG